jgi:hypothetical protein
MYVGEAIGVTLFAVIALAVIAWLAAIGWNEQEKIGQARIACIEAGGVFLDSWSPTCVWSERSK